MIFKTTNEIADRMESYQKAWIQTYCKPEPNETCKRCKHTGEDHRVSAIDNEYRSPCAKEVYPFRTTSMEPQFGAVEVTRIDDACDCDDFVFSDNEKQIRHLKLLKEGKR